MVASYVLDAFTHATGSGAFFSKFDLNFKTEKTTENRLSTNKKSFHELTSMQNMRSGLFLHHSTIIFKFF
jgi:hypothetical protein